MSTSVKSILELPIMQENSRLLTNTGENNDVQFVTVMESPDFRLASLGEHIFVLTTLSAHHSSLEEINSIVRGLCEVKIAAIGIKIGRYIKCIDESTIQIANDHNVALIELDNNVYFREILRETLSVITGNQRLNLIRINDVNKALIDSILQNRTIQDFLNLLCAQIDCYCCCNDQSGKKIAEASSLRLDYDTKKVDNAIKHYFENFSEKDKSIYQEENIIISPCIVQEKRLATICIVTFEVQIDLVYLFTQSIINGISIKFLEKNLQVQAERELEFSILNDILFSKNSNAEVIADRLDLLNFTLYENKLMVILSRLDSKNDKFGFYSTVDNLKKIFTAQFGSAIAFKRKNEHVILVSHETISNANSLKDRLYLCKSAISRTERGKFDLGCSTSVTELTKIPECYDQAKKAIKFGRQIDTDEHLYLYDDYFELGLISCGIGSSDANMFFQRIVNPIQEYDKKFNSELWSTLEISLIQDRLELIASTLHIHISTLRYRLQKIETITGYNYFKTNDRLTLYLAYLLYKVSNVSKQ
ncbi:MAG: PucR family transcriptional regulator ligand-binding domain-containing protein [Eubacteriales bacterium]|nr:PucR family transcriptional regulator ligand-binding domain-containing protein [Eubacteriales bacterium]